jgi:3D (Asp-Asp-Asp) domain-containing protein
MRIISKLVVALVLLAVVMPQITLAAETADTNETQTNIHITDGFAASSAYAAGAIPYSSEGFVPLSHSEEIKRELVLARYKSRLENAVLPEGKFVINASAYTASADECGNSKGITASGLKVMEKRTLACPPQYPLGTKIKINGFGTFVCEDRGGAIKGNHFDIYMQTKTQAFAFGRKNLEAEVVLN